MDYQITHYLISFYCNQQEDYSRFDSIFFDGGYRILNICAFCHEILFNLDQSILIKTISSMGGSESVIEFLLQLGHKPGPNYNVRK